MANLTEYEALAQDCQRAAAGKKTDDLKRRWLWGKVVPALRRRWIREGRAADAAAPGRAGRRAGWELWAFGSHKETFLSPDLAAGMVALLKKEWDALAAVPRAALEEFFAANLATEIRRTYRPEPDGAGTEVEIQEDGLPPTGTEWRDESDLREAA